MIYKIPDPDDLEDSGSGIFQSLFAMKKLVKSDVTVHFSVEFPTVFLIRRYVSGVMPSARPPAPGSEW